MKTSSGTSRERDGKLKDIKVSYSSENEMWKAKNKHSSVVTVHIQRTYSVQGVL